MFLSINSKMKGVTSGAVTLNPSAAYKFTLEISGARVAPSLVFYVVFCRWLFVLLPFSVSSLYCQTFEFRFLITPSNHFSVLSSALQNSVFHFVFFRFVIVLSVLRFTASDYTFKQSLVFVLCSGFQIIVCPFVISSFRHCIVLRFRLLITLSNFLFNRKC